jgi:hypothetical protein
MLSDTSPAAAEDRLCYIITWLMNAAEAHSIAMATVFNRVVREYGARTDHEGLRLSVVLAAAAPEPHQGDEPVLTLQWDDTIQEFESHTDGTKRRGRVRCAGTSLAAPGNTIELSGMGAPFDGTVRVTDVRHEIANGTWTTEFAFGGEENYPGA